MTDKKKSEKKVVEEFNAYYAGTRYVDGKVHLKFYRVDNNESLSFSGKSGNMNVGAVYPFKRFDNDRYRIPSWDDILHHKARANDDQVTEWQIHQRAGQELKKAVNFKPSDTLQSIVDDLRHHRGMMSWSQKAAFANWLQRELMK